MHPLTDGANRVRSSPGGGNTPLVDMVNSGDEVLAELQVLLAHKADVSSSGTNEVRFARVWFERRWGA
jgi:hypothetical protein